MNTYFIYGLYVRVDFCIPFLKKESNIKFIDVDVNYDNGLLYLEPSLLDSETFNELNIKKATIENRFYRCEIYNGNKIKYKFKSDKLDLSSILNFLHMPFAFILFQREILPLHGMSFVHKDESVVLSGISGAGKSSTTALLSKNYQIKSEDITGIKYDNNALWSNPSFPAILCEKKFSGHLNQFSDESLSRDRNVYLLNRDNFSSNKEIKVKKIYFLEWGKKNEIKPLNARDSLKAVLANSFKPSPLNQCIETEKIFLKNISLIINNTKIYLFSRKKNKPNESLNILLKHIEDD